MANTLEMHRLSEREIFYYRQRQRNRVFQAVIAHFANRAHMSGLTKRDLATLLHRDPAQITRWLSGPGNWTLDTISDLLLAMDAELEISVAPLNDTSTDVNGVQIFGDATDEPPQNMPLMVSCGW